MKVYIVYEVFNREYDNCLLLKSALEKNNYIVEIVYKMSLLSIKPSDEKTIIFIPNCYDDNNFQFYYYLCGHKNAVLINMQYEQVLSDDPENIDAHTPKGRAANIYNLCWGKGFETFLDSVGIKPSLSFVGGALHLDFLRDGFYSFWKSREDLASEFSLPTDKKWVLFISSFAYANNELVNRASDRVYGKDNNLAFRKLSNDSREAILNWFDEYLSKNVEKVIIYRKHPMEKYDNRLLSMASKYKNRFYLISDYNIKQWIYVSDDILNWFSTSAVECVAAQKSFEILRPIPVEAGTEVVLFKNARFIETFRKFDEYMKSEGRPQGYPFDVSLIKDMYEINNEPSFDKIINRLKTIEKENDFLNYVDPDYAKNRKRFIKNSHLLLKYRIKRTYQWFFLNLHIRLNALGLRKKYDIEDWEFQAKIKDDISKINAINKIVDDYYETKRSKNV